MKAGLRGCPSWSAAQYKTVVQRLVEAPHGAAIVEDLYLELSTVKEAAEAAVRAMVKANMLAYRPASGERRPTGTIASQCKAESAPLKIGLSLRCSMGKGHPDGGLWPRSAGRGDRTLSHTSVLHAPPSEARSPEVDCRGDWPVMYYSEVPYLNCEQTW